MSQECCVIAKTITNLTFALIRAIHIIIMMACFNKNNNKMQLQRPQSALLAEYFWKQLK